MVKYRKIKRNTCISQLGTPQYFEFGDCGYTTPCWLWRGSISDGYGKVTIKDVNYRVHIWMYEYHIGPIPVGMELDHLCKIRHCGNPYHLEPVTKTDNIRRGKATRLTINNAIDIKLALQVGFDRGILAKVFDVSRSSIDYIANNKTWR